MDNGHPGIGGFIGGIERCGDALVSGLGIAVPYSGGGTETAQRAAGLRDAGRGGRAGFGGVFKRTLMVASHLQIASALDTVSSARDCRALDWSDRRTGRSAGDGCRIRVHRSGDAWSVHLGISGDTGRAENSGDTFVVREWNSGRDVCAHLVYRSDAWRGRRRRAARVAATSDRI